MIRLRLSDQREEEPRSGDHVIVTIFYVAAMLGIAGLGLWFLYSVSQV